MPVNSSMIEHFSDNAGIYDAKNQPQSAIANSIHLLSASVLKAIGWIQGHCLKLHTSCLILQRMVTAIGKTTPAAYTLFVSKLEMPL